MALALGHVQLALLALLCVAAVAIAEVAPSTSPSSSADDSSPSSSPAGSIAYESLSVSSSPSSAPSPSSDKIQYYNVPDDVDGPSPAGSDAAAPGPDIFSDYESSDHF